LDVRNEDDVRWLYALIWPEHTERRSLLESAVSVAKANPPTLFEGDALAELPSITEKVPTEEQLCLFNTHVLYQLTPEQRDAFAEVVDQIGRGRDLFWIDCEWYGEEPEVQFTEYADGEKTSDVFANYDAHGRWIERIV
jgi:hypothetical protein